MGRGAAWRARGRGWRSTLALVALGSLLLGYGYGADEDPFVVAFQETAGHGASGEWPEAGAAARDLAAATREVAASGQPDLLPEIRRALEQRNPGELSRALTRLAVAMIRLKLERSSDERLERYYAAKYRLEAARSYYRELLAPAVRLRAAGGERTHAEIERGFDTARSALGSPGMFGRGRVAPDLDVWSAASQAILSALHSALPFVEESKS